MLGALGGVIAGSSAISSLGGSLGSSIFGISSLGISTISNLGRGFAADIVVGGSEGTLYMINISQVHNKFHLISNQFPKHPIPS